MSGAAVNGRGRDGYLALSVIVLVLVSLCHAAAGASMPFVIGVVGDPAGSCGGGKAAAVLAGSQAFVQLAARTPSLQTLPSAAETLNVSDNVFLCCLPCDLGSPLACT
jgi:hypothetical protein